MLKREFEERIGREVSDKDYDIIDFVYTFHPCISDTDGKAQVVAMYLACGIAPFRCMMKEAQKAKELEEAIRVTSESLESLKRDYETLK